MTRPTTRELVTVAAAARRVQRPRSTVQGWIDRDLIRRVGIDAAGRDVYDLAAVRRVSAVVTSRRRRR